MQFSKINFLEKINLIIFNKIQIKLIKDALSIFFEHIFNFHLRIFQYFSKFNIFLNELISVFR